MRRFVFIARTRLWAYQADPTGTMHVMLTKGVGVAAVGTVVVINFINTWVEFYAHLMCVGA